MLKRDPRAASSRAARADSMIGRAKVAVANRRARDGALGVQPAVPAVPARVDRRASPARDPAGGSRSSRCARSRRACARRATSDRRSDPRSGSSRSRAGTRGSSRCAPCTRRACRRADSSTPSTRSAVPGLAVLRIAPLPRVIVVVTDEEVPAHRLVLGGERVEGRHVVVVGVPAPAALAVTRIAAGLEHEHAVTRLRRAGRPRCRRRRRSRRRCIPAEIRWRHRLVVGSRLSADLPSSERESTARPGRPGRRERSERLQERDQRALVGVAQRGLLGQQVRAEVVALVDHEVRALAERQERLAWSPGSRRRCGRS